MRACVPQEVVRVVLAHGAAARSDAGALALWQAVARQHRGVVAALLDAGATLSSSTGPAAAL